MGNEIKFSILITVFNKEKYIYNTLISVLNQEYKNFEVIILNDGSTDKSEQIILGFTDPRINYYSQKNLGVSHARNNAIEKANAPYLAFLDADDIWFPNHLTNILSLIEKNPSEKVFATNSDLKIGSSLIKKCYSIEIKNDLVTNFFVASYINTIINSSTIVIHESVFEKIGYFNTSYKTGEDTDLFIRIGLNYNIVFTPKISVQIIVNKESLSRKTKSIQNRPTFEQYEIFEKKNKALKKYLDLNRFSLCIIAKMERNKDFFKNYSKKIDLENLNRKQQFLLNQHIFSIKMFYTLKKNLSYFNIHLSSFN